jgi:hypothetical protein
MRASWMIYLDADEFIILNRTDNIKTLLRNYYFADALSINWLMFGSSYHKKQPPGLLTENFVRSDMCLDKHVKTFVRPQCANAIIDPHSYKISNPYRYFAVTGNRKSEGPFNPVNRVFTKVPAYIAHYYVQSEEEFKRRKDRSNDIGGTPQARSNTFNFDSANKVMNNQLQNKYSLRIKNFLKLYNIEL